MKLVCHNEISEVYDNGDNWLWKSKIETSQDQIMPQKEFPFFPLAAVAKYDMMSDDEDEMEKLRSQNMEFGMERLKNRIKGK